MAHRGHTGVTQYLATALLLVALVVPFGFIINCSDSNFPEKTFELIFLQIAIQFWFGGQQISDGDMMTTGTMETVQLGLAPWQLAEATEAELAWTPPEGASSFQFSGAQPTDVANPPFVFSELALSASSPAEPTLQLSYRPPPAAAEHTFVDTFLARTSSGTVEGFSVSHLVGAQATTAGMKGTVLENPRVRLDAAAWRIRQWLYEAAGEQTLSLSEASELIEYLQSGDFFLGIRFPVPGEADVLSYRLPVSMQPDMVPKLAILDHDLPWDGDDLSQSVAQVPLEYAPERHEWLHNSLPEKPATRWASLAPVSDPVEIMEERFPLAGGIWELFVTGALDLRHMADGCEGCELEVYMCHEGAEAPPFFDLAGRSAATVAVLAAFQGDGVSCFGPFTQRLVDTSSGVPADIDPPFVLKGNGIDRVVPPQRVQFHHTIQVDQGQNLAFEIDSERGFDWTLYEGTHEQPNLARPVTGNLMVQGFANLWLVADIPGAAEDGVETVRLGVSPAGEPDNQVWATDVLWVGDWVAPEEGEEPQYWIPVASHASGAQGSVWRTDLGLLNTGTAVAVATITLHGSGGPTSMVQAVPAGVQLILTDVVGQLGETGSGALEVRATSDLAVTSRTFSQVRSGASCFPDGTLGQSLDATAGGEGLSAGQGAVIPQLQENPAYRTNVAVINTGTANASVRVHLLDGNGTELTSYDVELEPGEWRQEDRPFFARAGVSDLASASARLEVLSGNGIVAYGSVVDNTTNDPTTMSMLPATGGAVTAWVPVAVHAPGAEGSQWRTDLGLLNTAATAVDATVILHDDDGGVTMTRTVAAGQQLILADVVGEMGVASAAALEVTGTGPLMVTSRTYSQVDAAASCYPGGTLGQSLGATAAGAGLAAGQTAVIPQLQENAGYRSNVAVINTGETVATARVHLMDGAGTELVSYEVELEPGEWRQEDRPFFRRAAQTEMAAGWARIEVLSGDGVVAYGSVVSNITNDPTTMAMVP